MTPWALSSPILDGPAPRDESFTSFPRSLFGCSARRGKAVKGSTRPRPSLTRELGNHDPCSSLTVRNRQGCAQNLARPCPPRKCLYSPPVENDLSCSTTSLRYPRMIQPII